MIQGPAERGKVNLQTSVYIQLKHIWCEYVTFTFPPNKIIPFPSLQPLIVCIVVAARV